MDLEDHRQSSTHYFHRGKPAENFLRLCRLIMTICTDILRDVLSRYIKPADLRSELDKNRHRLEKIMNTEQKKLIYPANGNKALAAKHLDISVMYIILRNICNIPNHQNGWGNPPKTGDNSMAACIERIRIQRNEISAHHTNGEIEETEFNNRWTELEEAVLEIERQLTGGDLYERGVRYFLRCDLNFGQAEKPIQVEHPQVDVDMSDVGNSEAGKGGLDLFYDDSGTGVRFAVLFDELAEKIPPTKISQIQDLIENSCRVDNMASLEHAKTARDCLRFLKKERLFIPTDVIFIQYLLKNIDCRDLFDKCYRYAEAQKALCFYEKPPESGFRNIQVHVLGNLTEYSSERIKQIKDTVAAIVGCTSEEILVGGFTHSNSFFVILTIKDIYYSKLLDMGQQDRDKLRQHNIDFLIVDLNVILLDPWKEIEWKTYCNLQSPSQDMIEQIHQKEREKTTLPALQHVSSESEKTIEDMHNTLIADLLNRFLMTKDEKKNILWKRSFRQYCEFPAQQDCLIEEDLAYLESQGLLGIGNYDKLIDILDYVDKRAVAYVKEARKEIKRRSMHSKAGGLYLFYDDSGAGVRFAELFNELAEKIPPTKINQIKDLIESSCSVDNMASLEHAKTARDCLRFLKKEGLFIPTDVIFIQYLLKKIDCRDLFDKCYRYAEAQKALCFYEKPPESGFRNIQVHVLGNLTEYSSERIKKIKDTVAAIVGCTSEEILVGGFTHSNSFFVILAIKDIYYSKLLDMGQQDRDKLRQLNIDFLIVDLKEILLDPWKDIEWKANCSQQSSSQEMIEQMHQKEREKKKNKGSFTSQIHSCHGLEKFPF